MNEEDFYFEESNIGQIILKIIFFLIFAGLCVLAFFYIKNKFTIRLNNITYEVGDQLSFDLKTYLKSNKLGKEKDYILELSNVPTEKGIISEAGEYKYTIEYKNFKKEGKIKVKDTKAPVVEVEDITIGLNEEFIGDDFILKCVDYSKPCNVELSNESDYELSKKEGTYNLTLIIKDKYDNKTTENVVLTVKKGAKNTSSKVNDLTVSSISPSFKDYDGTLVLKYSKAIEEDEIFGDELFQKLLDITSGDLHEYLNEEDQEKEIKQFETIYAYNKYGYVVGYSVRIELSDGTITYIKK